MKDFTLGIMGGGQLARMLAIAAHQLGIKTLCVDSHENSPASFVTNTLICSYQEVDRILEFFSDTDSITYEFENIPHETLSKLSEKFHVFPSVQALKISQHRVKEKKFCESIGVPVVPYKAAENINELLSINDLYFPGILKSAQGGYDGKGQCKVKSRQDLILVAETFGDAEVILENFVPFDKEYSCIAVRSVEGKIRFYDISENTHVDGILNQSISPPSDLKEEIAKSITSYTQNIAEKLDYVGVIAVEYFLKGETVFFNEFAPRVHNTGHWTIEGAYTSQFENHVRACLSLPLGSTAGLGHSAMYNLLGSRGEVPELLSREGIHYHWYGKSEILPKRKVGHVSICEQSRDRTLELLSYIKSHVT